MSAKIFAEISNRPGKLLSMQRTFPTSSNVNIRVLKIYSKLDSLSTLVDGMKKRNTHIGTQFWQLLQDSSKEI